MRSIFLVTALLCVLPLLLFFPIVHAQTLVTVIPLGTQNLNEGALGPPVFDPSNGNLYVPALGTDNEGTVSIISGSDNTVTSILGLSTPQFKASPGVALLDPSNGNVYVPDGPFIHVISGTTNKIIQNISGISGVGFDYVGSLALDTSNGMIYDQRDSSVSVVDTSNNSVISTLQLSSGGGSFHGLLYDPANGDLYVPGFNETTVISTATNRIVDTIPFANGAGDLALDTSTGSVLAAGSGRFVLISSSNQVIANVSSPGAGYSVFDPSNSDFYSLSSSSVEVFSAKSNSLVGNMSLNFEQQAGSGSGLAIDSANGDVLATFSVSGVIVNSQSITATFGDVISGTTVLGQVQVSNSSATSGDGVGSAAFDSANGDFYVPNLDGTVSVVNPQVLVVSSSVATTTTTSSHAGSLSPAYLILVVAQLFVVLSALMFVRIRRSRR